MAPYRSRRPRCVRFRCREKTVKTLACTGLVAEADAGDADRAQVGTTILPTVGSVTERTPLQKAPLRATRQDGRLPHWGRGTTGGRVNFNLAKLQRPPGARCPFRRTITCQVPPPIICGLGIRAFSLHVTEIKQRRCIRRIAFHEQAIKPFVTRLH
jgi:hypothetical protein